MIFFFFLFGCVGSKKERPLVLVKPNLCSRLYSVDLYIYIYIYIYIFSLGRMDIKVQLFQVSSDFVRALSFFKLKWYVCFLRNYWVSLSSIKRHLLMINF